jgi:YjbR protein
MALALEGAIESAHMGHPDFRVANRIFATLHADGKFGMVALTPEQQQEFIAAHPRTFAPESGAWGRAGCTKVHLASVDEEVLGEALTLARRYAVAKTNAQRSKRKRSGKPVSPSRKR